MPMKMLIPPRCFVLMVSVGMSLRWRELIANWRSLTWGSWARLLLATFILPPAAALLLAKMVSLDLADDRRSSWWGPRLALHC